MKKLLRVFLMSILAQALLMPGCSNDPVSPGNATDQQLTARPGNQSRTDGLRANLGYYMLTVSPDTGDAQILPVRNAAIHINATSFLNRTMGISIETVPAESDPEHGLFALDITLTHPSNDKPQLAGFDVKGVLMTPGTLTIAPLVLADADE